MRNRERASFAWRALLVIAIGAFALAAVATEFGNDALSRFAGTAAWSTAIVGAIIGLIVEPRHGTSP
jgi:Na+-transporting NADH:ubiquinone oxidoreductase subunit NqrB